MSQREIRVDPERLAALASSLHLAHNTLAASPTYAHLEAGDVRRRLPDAVSGFINNNNGPREELIQQLDQAAQALDAASQGFGDTESCLVRALTGEGS
jgi:hypothetical protein